MFLMRIRYYDDGGSGGGGFEHQTMKNVYKLHESTGQI